MDHCWFIKHDFLPENLSHLEFLWASHLEFWWASVNTYKNTHFRNGALYFLSWPTSLCKPFLLFLLHPSRGPEGAARPFYNLGWFSLSQTKDNLISYSFSLYPRPRTESIKFVSYLKVDRISTSKNSETEIILRWAKQYKPSLKMCYNY